MYIILLRLTAEKERAAAHLQGHKQWIQEGISEGVFLLTGSLTGGQGGVVLAHNEEPNTLKARVQRDPFVAEGVVTAEVIELEPAVVDKRLRFLMGED